MASTFTIIQDAMQISCSFNIGGNTEVTYNWVMTGGTEVIEVNSYCNGVRQEFTIQSYPSWIRGELKTTSPSGTEKNDGYFLYLTYDENNSYYNREANLKLIQTNGDSHKEIIINFIQMPKSADFGFNLDLDTNNNIMELYKVTLDNVINGLSIKGEQIGENGISVLFDGNLTGDTVQNPLEIPITINTSFQGFVSGDELRLNLISGSEIKINGFISNDVALSCLVENIPDIKYRTDCLYDKKNSNNALDFQTIINFSIDTYPYPIKLIVNLHINFIEYKELLNIHVIDGEYGNNGGFKLVASADKAVNSNLTITGRVYANAPDFTGERSENFTIYINKGTAYGDTLVFYNVQYNGLHMTYIEDLNVIPNEDDLYTYDVNW